MKIALIGLGMVARTHVDAIADLKDKVTLHGVLSRSHSSAHSFVQSISDVVPNTPKIYGTVAEIAEDPEVDFVIICTPPDARAEIIEILAKAQKPMVLEKPIERDFAASLAIVETCEAANLPLGIVFQHRMRSASKALTDLIKTGDLGEISVVEMMVPWWRDQSYYDAPGRGTYARDGGGVLITQAIHTIDLALSFTGPVTAVQAIARTTKMHKMETEDYVSAGLEFANGAVGSLVASTACFPGNPEVITLHCTKGSACLKSGQLHLNWQDGRNEIVGDVASAGGGVDPMAFTHAWHQGIIEDFADALTQNRPPVATGRDALQAQKLIDAIVLSSKNKCMITLSEME